MDIIVTTPKNSVHNAKLEAEECKKAGGGTYFRLFHSTPKVSKGDKIWYVEDDHIRGYCVVDYIMTNNGSIVCSTTGKKWSGKCAVYMDASTWKWIRPLPMKGFRGYRYFKQPSNVKIVGDWMAEKPKVDEPYRS